MSEKIQVSIGFSALPVTTGFSGSLEGNIAVPPSNSATLRQIAENLQGEDPMRVAFAEILLQAAADSERLDWLIEGGAYLSEGISGWNVMRHVCEDEFELLSHNGKSPRDAIDVAMGKESGDAQHDAG